MIRDLRKTISAVEIIQKYNLSYQTVNYYTNLDLLPAVKNKGNKRLYDAQEVDFRLKRIQQLKNEGYPLRLIKRELLKQ
ncbi:MAG: MerR family transcriptional regulator [Candidatus Omnitrophota bacterium]|nr:MerR family transcriptional regulator [Candidatus Omnitrophota bacterium]